MGHHLGLGRQVPPTKREKKGTEEFDIEGAPEADLSDWLRRDRKQIFTFRSDSEGCEHQFTEGEQEPPPDAHTTYFLQLRNADLSEQLNTKTTNSAELENKFDDCSYELNKTKASNEKLETLLLETQSELSV